MGSSGLLRSQSRAVPSSETDNERLRIGAKGSHQGATGAKGIPTGGPDLRSQGYRNAQGIEFPNLENAVFEGNTGDQPPVRAEYNAINRQAPPSVRPRFADEDPTTGSFGTPTSQRESRHLC